MIVLVDMWTRSAVGGNGCGLNIDGGKIGTAQTTACFSMGNDGETGPGEAEAGHAFVLVGISK